MEYSFSISDSVSWNKYVAEMAGGTKCIGSPVFFFFKIGTTQLVDVSQMVNLDELARVAKAYHLKFPLLVLPTVPQETMASTILSASQELTISCNSLWQEALTSP